MRRLQLILLAALALWAAAARASSVPARQRTLLVLRTLAYDRNLTERVRGDVVVAVVFRPGNAASETERDEVMDALAAAAQDVVVAGRAVRAVAVPFTTAAEVDERLGALHPAAAWISESLVGHAADLARITRARKVLSAAGSRAAVAAGLAIGVVPGPRRPVILVNVPAARSEGADLDPTLLAIAEIVPAGP